MNSAVDSAGKAVTETTDAINDSIRSCFESDDYKEGVRAFLEKRPADFRGR